MGYMEVKSPQVSRLEQTGNMLLKPSIWVRKSYQRYIFSAITQNEHYVLLELIKRVALFIILSLSAIFTAPLILPGLALKKLSSWFYTPPKIPTPPQTPPKIPTPPQTPPQTPRPPERRNSDSSDGPESEEDPESGRSSPNPALQARLQSIGKKIEKLAGTRRSIQSSDLKHLLDQLTSIQKENGNSGYDISEYQILWGQIENLQYFHDYEMKRIYVGEEGGMLSGEMNAEDNGDCVYESFCLLAQIYGSFTYDDTTDHVHSERIKTVEWLKDKREDTTVQCNLIQSMYEHYQNKIQALNNEKANWQSTEAKGEVPPGFTKGRQAMIDSEIQWLKTNVMSVIYWKLENKDDPESISQIDDISALKWFSEIEKLDEKKWELEAKSSLFEQEKFELANIKQQIDEIKNDHFSLEVGENARKYCSLMWRYFHETRQKGVHVGAAELYALSYQHKACCRIIADVRDKETGKILSTAELPPINPQFKEKVRRFHYNGTHYNPIFIPIPPTPPQSPVKPSFQTQNNA